MMLKKFIKKFLETCPKELLGNKVPDTYADLRRIMISRNNITATKNVLEALYKVRVQTVQMVYHIRFKILCTLICLFNTNFLKFIIVLFWNLYSHSLSNTPSVPAQLGT